MNSSCPATAPKPSEANIKEGLNVLLTHICTTIDNNLNPLLENPGKNPPNPFGHNVQAYDNTTRALLWTARGMPWSTWLAPQTPPQGSAHERIIWEDKQAKAPDYVNALIGKINTHISSYDFDHFTFRVTLFRCKIQASIGEKEYFLSQPIRENP